MVRSCAFTELANLTPGLRVVNQLGDDIGPTRFRASLRCRVRLIRFKFMCSRLIGHVIVCLRIRSRCSRRIRRVLFQVIRMARCSRNKPRVRISRVGRVIPDFDAGLNGPCERCVAQVEDVNMNGEHNQCGRFDRVDMGYALSSQANVPDANFIVLAIVYPLDNRAALFVGACSI